MRRILKELCIGDKLYTFNHQTGKLNSFEVYSITGENTFYVRDEDLRIYAFSLVPEELSLEIYNSILKITPIGFSSTDYDFYSAYETLEERNNIWL